MPALIKTLDNISLYTGKLTGWLILLMVFLSCLIVLLRYGFAIGSIALQELLLYCHGTVFMLGAAYTLQQDEHVRVDIFYQHFSPRQKAWVNAIGTLVLLIPFCLFLLIASAWFFHAAWLMQESSSEPGGLAFVYLFKGVMPLALFLLLLQACNLLLQSACTLVIREPESWS